MDVQNGGGPALDELARRLKRAADGRVVDAAADGLQSVVGQLADAARDGASRLPASGGLAKRVASTAVNGRVTRAGGSALLRMTAGRNAVRDPNAIDRGRVRRPTYGHRPYVIQQVRPGWFREAIAERAKAVAGRKVRAKVSETLRRT